MLHLRKSKDRGHANHGWLESYHSFSFADYYDPEVMGFRCLRVINEDFIAAGRGFPTHAHNDMEILTYVVSSELEHKDSMGNSAVIRPGEIQRMSAGSGVRHSEFNPSSTEKTHLLQIWLLTEKNGIKPGYEQKSFEEKLKAKHFSLIASRDGREVTTKIHQDVDLYAGRLLKNETHEMAMRPGRHGWLQLIKGKLNVNSLELSEGDGLAMSEEIKLQIRATTDSELLFFDLP